MWLRALPTQLKFVVGAMALTFVVANAGPASAACHPTAPAASPQTVSGFLGNPGDLLSRFPNGGPQMITQIRDLATSDPATLDVILNLLGNANGAQKSAIGSGLAQAAKICVRGDQGYSTKIQESIAKTKDEQVWLAYTSVIGDIQLGGVGGGQGSGGAIGGQTNPLPGGPTGTGPAQPIPGGAVPTAPKVVTGGVGGLSGPGGGTNGSNGSNTFIRLSEPISQ